MCADRRRLRPEPLGRQVAPELHVGRPGLRRAVDRDREEDGPAAEGAVHGARVPEWHAQDLAAAKLQREREAVQLHQAVDGARAA